MNLAQFADIGGCRVFHCDGEFGYTTIDDPHSSVCGYDTADEALMGWLEDEFGTTAGGAVLYLLEQLRGKP